MNRRDFFRFGLQSAAKMAGDAMADKLGLESESIRPPFALHRAAFVDACTKCDACIEACAYNIIFKLSDDTPALDLGVSGCHLCADWPCVAACEPGALKLPLRQENEPPALPKLADGVINTWTCLPYAGPRMRRLPGCLPGAGGASLGKGDQAGDR